MVLHHRSKHNTEQHNHNAAKGAVKQQNLMKDTWGSVRFLSQDCWVCFIFKYEIWFVLLTNFNPKLAKNLQMFFPLSHAHFLSFLFFPLWISWKWTLLFKHLWMNIFLAKSNESIPSASFYSLPSNLYTCWCWVDITESSVGISAHFLNSQNKLSQ